MTYREIKRKYMLKEISEEEYERCKEKLIEKLFEMYEENIIDEKMLKDKTDMLRE